MRPSLETGATGNTPFTAADLTAREDQLVNTKTQASPPQTPSRRSSSQAGLVEMPTTTKEQQCLY